MKTFRISRAAARLLSRPQAAPRAPLHYVRWLSASAAGGLLGATGLLMANRPLLAKEVEVNQEVWTWGKRESIPGGADRDVLRPLRIRWFEGHKAGWKKLAFGPCFGAALDGNGQVFVWGLSEAETEDGPEEIFIGPTLLEAQGYARGQSFIDVQCSSEHIFVLTASGSTYVFSGVPETLRRTKLSGQAPLKLDGQRMPGIPNPNSMHRFMGGGGVTQMSIGLEHAAFVTHRGELLCTGANQWGQCGEVPPREKERKMGAYEETARIETVTPVKVTFPANVGKITSVHVGGAHTVAMDDLGQIFALGDDRRIQLGLGDTRTAGGDERHGIGVLNREALGGKGTKADLKRAANYKYYDLHMQAAPVECIPPPVTNRPAYPPAQFIACGQDFTVAGHRDSPDWYAKDEETNVLFCCGENGEGQCGRNKQQQQQPWLMVKMPKRSKITAVTCGQGHSIAQMSSGELWAWGLNQQGEVGNGTRAGICPPVKVALEPLEPDGLSRKSVVVNANFRNSGCICEVEQSEK